MFLRNRKNLENQLPSNILENLHVINALEQNAFNTKAPCNIFTNLYQKEAFKINSWASLVAQWLRICLPMQGTRVRALVWEDPTCRGATKPVRHNY